MKLTIAPFAIEGMESESVEYVLAVRMAVRSPAKKSRTFDETGGDRRISLRYGIHGRIT